MSYDAVMDFHQLKVFSMAVKGGSFTAASQLLRLSQSTISQHIKQLEEDLGCELFLRVGRRVVLTEAGKLLSEHCERIFQDVQNAERALKELNGLQRGRVRFGSGATTLIYQLPTVFETFIKEYPSIELVIMSDTTDVILNEIRVERLDLGLVMRPFEERDFDFTPLCEEEVMIAIPSNHPFASKKKLSIHDLNSLQFILYEQETVMRKIIDQHFEKLGVQPRIAMVMENIEAIKSLVGAGLGASVLPEHAVGNEALDKKVKLMRAGNQVLFRELGLVRQKGAAASIATKELSKTIISKLGRK